MSTEELVNTYHNPNLVDKTKSPNENRQVLIFNDGEIIDTKGGWAFLHRSFFPLSPKLDNVNFKMPLVLDDNTYAIVETLEIAKKIRDSMINN